METLTPVQEETLTYQITRTLGFVVINFNHISIQGWYFIGLLATAHFLIQFCR